MTNSIYATIINARFKNGNERRYKMLAIRKFRESLGLKQEDFAEIIHVSKVNYSKKENGKVKFSLNEAFLISNHFKKPIETIFGDNKVSKTEPY